MSEQQVNEKIREQIEHACRAIGKHAANVAVAAGEYKSSFTIRIEIDPTALEARINYDLDAWAIPEPREINDLYRPKVMEREGEK